MIKSICLSLVMMDFIATRILAEIYCPGVEVLETGGLTCDVIKGIVNIHNEFREKIAKGRVVNQPPASNMRKMYWDDELARRAQDWANRCTFRHNSPRDRKVARFAFGQNIGLTKTIGYSTHYMEFKKHIQSWFKEYTDYKFRPYDMKQPTTGHYTQMAWADTYLIGCGYTRYRKNSIMHKLHVCNYGPAGNYLTQTPYNVGKKLRCPRNFVLSKNFPHLCDLKKTPSSACTPNQRKLNETIENDNDSLDCETSDDSGETANHCDERSYILLSDIIMSITLKEHLKHKRKLRLQ